MCSCEVPAKCATAETALIIIKTFFFFKQYAKVDACKMLLSLENLP